ncbi:MAG: serine hydrolase domain-containing protein [Gammaproteobacteria bacterium]
MPNCPPPRDARTARAALRGALLLLLLALSVPGAHADAVALAALDRDLAALRERLDIPALAVLLVDRERVLLARTYGMADRAARVPFGPRHYFRVGSITKTFTALATLRLVREGHLALDDRLRDIVPTLAIDNPWQATHPVTIAHLLEHTAGLNDLTRREFDFNEPLTTAAAFAASPGSRRVRWPPGLHHAYSNNSPGLLTAAIEHVTGMRYADYLQRAVLEPLGMHSATVLATPQVLADLVTGHDSDGTTPIPYWHMTYPAFGALNLRPADMAPFLQLFLNRGRHAGAVFLDAPLIERMETPRTTLAARAGLRFGYGLGLYTFLHDDHVFFGHGGDADGYLSRFAYQPQAGLAYYVGINVFRSADLRRVRRRVEAFIVARLPPAAPATATVPAAILGAYAGDYAAVTWRFPDAPAAAATPRRLSIVFDDARLLLRRAGQPDRVLVPVTRRQFRFAHEPVATLAFIEHDARLYLQMDDGNYARTAAP